MTAYFAADHQAEMDPRPIEAYTRQSQEDLGAQWAALTMLATAVENSNAVRANAPLTVPVTGQG